MTAPLTTEQIQQLRSMERKLLGERPWVVSVAAEEDSRPPWLRGREGPRGLHGWLGVAPEKTTASVAEAAATWPSNFPDPGDAIERRFELRKLRLSIHDRDAPTMIMSAHKANPGWDIAKIGESLGLPSWYVSLVIAMRCKIHDHRPMNPSGAGADAPEGAFPALDAESDSGWRVQGEWLVRMVVGKPTRM